MAKELHDSVDALPLGDLLLGRPIRAQTWRDHVANQHGQRAGRETSSGIAKLDWAHLRGAWATVAELPDGS